MTQQIRRANWHIIFGEDDTRWQIGDPGCSRIMKARRASLYGPTTREDTALLASVVSDFAYLVRYCPTTKLACEKLAQMRAAVRALPESDDEETL
jgi:hypothetical protein